MRINKLIGIFILLPAWCYAVEFDEIQYSDTTCKNNFILCAIKIVSPKGNNSKTLFFHNGKLRYIILTNKKMKNEGRSSLAMTIGENYNISDTNIDEFLYFKSGDMNQLDKNKRFGDPRYRFLGSPCFHNCSPYLFFDIDYKFKPDEQDKIFFSVPTDDTDFYKSFHLNKRYLDIY